MQQPGRQVQLAVIRWAGRLDVGDSCIVKRRLDRIHYGGQVRVLVLKMGIRRILRREGYCLLRGQEGGRKFRLTFACFQVVLRRVRTIRAIAAALPVPAAAAIPARRRRSCCLLHLRQFAVSV